MKSETYLPFPKGVGAVRAGANKRCDYVMPDGIDHC
jgi:hypothetical protein